MHCPPSPSHLTGVTDEEGGDCPWLWKLFPQTGLALPLAASSLKAEGGKWHSLCIVLSGCLQEGDCSLFSQDRHLCQKVREDIYLPETHLTLSATGGDKGIMSRKGKGVSILMGREYVLGVMYPPCAWEMSHSWYRTPGGGGKHCGMCGKQKSRIQIPAFPEACPELSMSSINVLEVHRWMNEWLNGCFKQGMEPKVEQEAQTLLVWSCIAAIMYACHLFSTLPEWTSSTPHRSWWKGGNRNTSSFILCWSPPWGKPIFRVLSWESIRTSVRTQGLVNSALQLGPNPPFPS